MDRQISYWKPKQSFVQDQWTGANNKIYLYFYKQWSWKYHILYKWKQYNTNNEFIRHENVKFSWSLYHPYIDTLFHYSICKPYINKYSYLLRVLIYNHVLTSYKCMPLPPLQSKTINLILLLFGHNTSNA